MDALNRCLLRTKTYLPAQSLSHSIGILRNGNSVHKSSMVSKLEDLLLRYTYDKARLRVLVLNSLDDRSLRNLRLTSRVLHDLVDHSPTRMFRQLFVFIPWSGRSEPDSLRAVAPFCRKLIVKFIHKEATLEQDARRVSRTSRQIGKPHPSIDRRVSARERWQNVRKTLAASSRGTSPSSTIRSTDRASLAIRSSISSRKCESSRSSAPSEMFEWAGFLKHCQTLRDIVVSIAGDPGWPGRIHVEDALVAFRAALEDARLEQVCSVRLAPVHAMGIVHLRWSGCGAFGTIFAISPNFWSQLHTFDIQLHNPFLEKRGLSERQQIMFRKILYDYLRSFASTLKRLRFTWIDGEGPSPMTLELEPGLKETRQAIVWKMLEEVYLGNILLPYRTIRLLPERVTKTGVRLRTLRSTYENSPAVFEDGNAWIEVILNSIPRSTEHESVFSEASSMYSQ